jgi:hypothetical protein
MAKTPTDIRSLARSHGPAALKTLAGIMNEKDAPPAARVAAANSLLDRGWGKAVQPVDATINDERSVNDLSSTELDARIAAILVRLESLAGGAPGAVEGEERSSDVRQLN